MTISSNIPFELVDFRYRSCRCSNGLNGFFDEGDDEEEEEEDEALDLSGLAFSKKVGYNSDKMRVIVLELETGVMMMTFGCERWS